MFMLSVFAGKLLKEVSYAVVPELSFSGDEEMLTQFRVKYLHQVGEFRHLRFIPTETLQTSLPRSKVKGKKSLDNTSVAKPGATEGSKRKVLSRYPSDVIYIVSEVHTPGEVMELTLYPGDHVALLKNKDPLGRCDRWFVDDGENKGFARASCLKPYKPSDHQVGTVTALPSSISTAVPLPPAHPASIPRPSTLPRAAPTPPLPERPPRYEDLFPSVPVARDRPSQPVGSNSYNRAAPPPRYSLGQEVSVSSAQTPLPSKAGHRDSAPGSNGHSHVSESDYYAPPLDRQQSNEYNSPVSEENNIYEEIDQGITKPVSEEDSVHTDESPIYEAIEDRNHPYQNLGADGNDIKATEHPLPDSEVDEPKFYYAMYNFGGSDGTQLNLLAGQVVLLVEAKSSDWWFVEDRHGNQDFPNSWMRWLKPLPFALINLVQVLDLNFFTSQTFHFSSSSRQ
ncbi:hypothetical protein SK128_028513 [Halocaridina rubra]|uniref:SH3 domain-containing protein n=1 Tax=Halocaridina rubra TaxID=373956 RepID=A0AAN8XMM5_HALRR